ncbi:MAG: rod shape-determining protein RodA [Candidatus Obscuribacterales bacterium]|nr:rod shape-determining protein RodA [Candidatus Obscuribacterales bacterium]
MNSPLSRPLPINVALKQIFGFVTGIDWIILACTFFLIFIGLSTLKYSVHTAGYYQKQLEFAWVGLALMLTFSRMPYKILTNKWTVPIMYVVNLVLLVAVMVKGHSAQGAQRWLALGPITLQPSEIAKLVVIFTLSAWLSTRPIRSFFDIFKVLAIILPPAVLVFKQPDLGTSLTFGAVFFGMTFWAGATICDVLALTSPLISLILNAVNPTWWLYFIGILGAVLLLFWRRSNWNFWIRLLMVLIICGGNYAAGEMRPHMWGLLKEYQQKRLTSFVNPYDDPRGSGYHILQSLIAIGSGGPEGAGLGKGNQSQGAFIPERHTDFIFAVVGEEWGFKFTALVVFAYACICIRALMIAHQARGEPAGSLMALGLMCMFLFHVFLNIGMVIGIMPVAGVPLPFLSYGGTALLVDMSSIGFLLSIKRLNPPERKEEWTV